MPWLEIIVPSFSGVDGVFLIDLDWCGVMGSRIVNRDACLQDWLVGAVPVIRISSNLTLVIGLMSRDYWLDRDTGFAVDIVISCRLVAIVLTVLVAKSRLLPARISLKPNWNGLGNVLRILFLHLDILFQPYSGFLDSDISVYTVISDWIWNDSVEVG